jgi:glycosyltransferase involved in cell wall biosynthesis
MRDPLAGTPSPVGVARLATLRIALVHDWLTGYRGGERVLDHLARRYPDADLFTLFHSPGQTTPAIDALRITASPLNKIPGIARHYRKLLPLFPWAIRRFDLEGYDLVLSTSHAVAKSVRIPEGVPHLCYCFTPMRYIWDQSEAYLGRGLIRWLAAPLVAALRRFDVATADSAHVTRFVAISSEVADRIQRHYGREASIVAPPVVCTWIEPSRSGAPRIDSGSAEGSLVSAEGSLVSAEGSLDSGEGFYLLVGGFVPYKSEALAIEAFRGLERKLIVAGDGPSRSALEKTAPPNVEFTGRVDDARLAALYRGARALVYPQREDFGLVAVEAQAAGLPVIALGAGGARDTVRPLQITDFDSTQPTRELATGIFFDQPTPGALAEAIELFEKAEQRFDRSALRSWATRFSPARFDREFDREISACFAQRGADTSESQAGSAR